MLDESDADIRPALALLAAPEGVVQADELGPALRRAMLLLAAGGDPHRELQLDGRAVTALPGARPRGAGAAAGAAGGGPRGPGAPGGGGPPPPPGPARRGPGCSRTFLPPAPPPPAPCPPTSAAAPSPPGWGRAAARRPPIATQC